MIQFPAIQQAQEALAIQTECEHRTVSKDGRIVCCKITRGDDTVSPETCRACPARSVGCTHLRFSLNHSAHAPLVVRFNGRTEIWADEAPELGFHHAACAARVTPILHARSCAACPMRVPCQVSAPAAKPSRQPRARARVVAFPVREPEPALATG